MSKTKITASLVLLMAATLILAACQQNTPVAPTIDANAIYTQAAATVAAGLAQTQQALPSPTPTPPPPTPTVTMIVNPTATLNQPGPGNETPTATQAVVLTPMPTNTPAVAQPSVADKAEWVSQSPVDGTEVGKKDVITVKYVLKNVGKTTWTPKYTFRYYAGDKMGSPNDLNLTKEVKPNETVEIVFQLTAPDKSGETNTVWVLTNADGVNFFSVYLKLVVK